MKARKLAYQVLCKIVIDGKYANLLMREDLKNLDRNTSGFITNIVYEVLRKYAYLHSLYSDVVKNKLDVKDEILLNMAVYELEYLKNEDYGVVNDYVAIASKKSFINAVLRNYLRNEKRQYDLNKLSDAALFYSIDLWILKLWTAHYGRQTALKIAESLQEIPQVTYCLNTLKASFADLATYDIKQIDKTAFLSSENLIYTKEFKLGYFIVQDYSAQQVVNFLDLKDNLKVLDVCAAPGSKTSQIAMMMHNTGEIVANDINIKRVNLIKNLANKLGITNLKTICKDGTNLNLESKFDRILLDVPCSGLGVLRKKPDIKLRLLPENLDEIVQIQKHLLESAIQYLTTDGVLVYSTCTLNKKENENQIANFIKSHPDFVLLAEKTIMPFDFQSDGFYMAKLKRVTYENNI